MHLYVNENDTPDYWTFDRQKKHIFQQIEYIFKNKQYNDQSNNREIQIQVSRINR